jgi:hypothetical protein
MDLNLLDLTTQLRAIGRPVVFVAGKWDGASPLTLTHLGDTEGEVGVEVNEEYSHLTLTELTGAGKHKSYIAGEDPVITIPIFYADPALRAIVSPTGNASGGYQRRRPVTERTLVLFPEELFYDAGDDAYTAISYNDADGWQMGGEDLTTDQESLLSLSMWFWRGYFTKAGPVFRHEDGGKAVQTVSFQAMHSDLPLSLIPDGQRIYTLGDPANAEIDIAPTAPA